MLQVPFVSAPEMRFTEELTELVGYCTIFIRPDAAPYNRLVIKDLATIEQACDQFATLKRAMLAASLNVGCGIRVKDDLAVLNDDAAQLPSEPDQPFVCRQERSLARLIITAAEPRYQLPRALPKVIQGIKVAMTSSFAVEATRDERVALACDLYTNSFFEKSVAASFITLIGTLEVLKDQESVTPEAIRLISGWLGKIDQLERSEAASFRGQLEHMTQLSISRGIGRVVSRHLGQDRGREIQKLYSIRSNLVHRGEHPADLQGSLEITQLIVRELLIKILRAGSR